MTKLSTKTNVKPAKPVTGPSKNKKVKKSECGCCSLFLQFTVTILIIFGSTCGYLYRTNMFPEYSFKDNEQFPITDISSVLCQQYTIDLRGPADIFLINGDARISSDKREIITKSENDFISSIKYSFYNVQLLEGSQIQVKGCRLFNTFSEAEILIIQGNEDWRSYKTGKCVDCIKKRVVIRESEGCYFGEGFDLEYYVHSADQYYIVLTQFGSQEHQEQTVLYSQLTLIKTMYDLTTVKQGCLGETSCTFNLTYAKNQNIIIMRQDEFKYNTKILITRLCRLRVMFWVGIFGILPASLILLSGLCCCFCAAVEKRGAREDKKLEIKQAIVNGV